MNLAVYPVQQRFSRRDLLLHQRQVFGGGTVLVAQVLELFVQKTDLLLNLLLPLLLGVQILRAERDRTQAAEQQDKEKKAQGFHGY